MRWLTYVGRLDTAAGLPRIQKRRLFWPLPTWCVCRATRIRPRMRQMYRGGWGSRRCRWGHLCSARETQRRWGNNAGPSQETTSLSRLINYASECHHQTADQVTKSPLKTRLRIMTTPGGSRPRINERFAMHCSLVATKCGIFGPTCNFFPAIFCWRTVGLSSGMYICAFKLNMNSGYFAWRRSCLFMCNWVFLFSFFFLLSYSFMVITGQQRPVNIISMAPGVSAHQGSISSSIQPSLVAGKSGINHRVASGHGLQKMGLTNYVAFSSVLAPI